MQPIPTIVLDPDELREIAKDLEDNRDDYCRTVETTDGQLIDIVTADTYERNCS